MAQKKLKLSVRKQRELKEMKKADELMKKRIALLEKIGKSSPTELQREGVKCVSEGIQKALEVVPPEWIRRIIAIATKTTVPKSPRGRKKASQNA